MFTFANAAKLAEIEPVRLRQWFERGHFELQRGDQNADQGGIRLLTPQTTLAICIAARLVRLGVPPARAITAGLAFAHTKMGSPRRKHSAALYDGPVITFVAIPPDEKQPARFFCLGAKSDGADAIVNIGEGATILPLNSIVQKIENAMASGEAAPAAGRA